VTSLSGAGRARLAIAATFACAAGLSIAWLDTRPGFDATGVTAAGLALAAAISVLIAGSRSPCTAPALAALVGAWVPIVEVPATGSPASLAALLFGAGGAALGAVALWLSGPPAPVER
jgi:hypothetical protein